MGLSRQVVYLHRLHLLKDADQVCGVREIAVMHDESAVGHMGILVQVIHPVCIEQ